MKKYLIYCFGMLILFGMMSCANGKKIQDQAPVALQDTYYTKSDAGLQLYIPLKAEKGSQIMLDSVYFRKRSAKLERIQQSPAVYHAEFPFPNTTDMVMSSDPRKEYGNKPPIIIGDNPFKLEQDEAVISFKKAEETYYFKIDDIKERDDDEVMIKNPKNIRH